MSLSGEIERRLAHLANGGGDPDEISNWAVRTMQEHEEEEMAAATWQALDRLSGCDLLAGPGRPLHSIEDFRDWYEDWRQAGPTQEG